VRPPIFEWHVNVRRWDHYGNRVEMVTPAVIRAADRVEVTEKVRTAFNAEYDTFRKFWSHDWTLREVREVAP
jgi:hypothetical protein